MLLPAASVPVPRRLGRPTVGAVTSPSRWPPTAGRPSGIRRRPPTGCPSPVTADSNARSSWQARRPQRRGRRHARPPPRGNRRAQEPAGRPAADPGPAPPPGAAFGTAAGRQDHEPGPREGQPGTPPPAADVPRRPGRLERPGTRRAAADRRHGAHKPGPGEQRAIAAPAGSQPSSPLTPHSPRRRPRQPGPQPPPTTAARSHHGPAAEAPAAAGRAAHRSASRPSLPDDLSYKGGEPCDQAQAFAPSSGQRSDVWNRWLRGSADLRQRHRPG